MSRHSIDATIFRFVSYTVLNCSVISCSVMSVDRFGLPPIRVSRKSLLSSALFDILLATIVASAFKIVFGSAIGLYSFSDM